MSANLAFSVLLVIGIVALTFRSNRSQLVKNRTLDKKLEGLSPEDPSLISVTRELRAGNTVAAIKAYRDSKACGLYEARYATKLLKEKLDRLRPLQ